MACSRETKGSARKRKQSQESRGSQLGFGRAGHTLHQPLGRQRKMGQPAEDISWGAGLRMMKSGCKTDLRNWKLTSQCACRSGHTDSTPSWGSENSPVGPGELVSSLSIPSPPLSYVAKIILNFRFCSYQSRENIPSHSETLGKPVFTTENNPQERVLHTHSPFPSTVYLNSSWRC